MLQFLVPAETRGDGRDGGGWGVGWGWGGAVTKRRGSCFRQKQGKGRNPGNTEVTDVHLNQVSQRVPAGGT